MTSRYKLMKKRLFDFLRAIPLNLVAFAAGMGLFCAGVYFIYPPGALIGAGAILMVISLFGEGKA
jgi:hypothetical protein